MLVEISPYDLSRGRITYRERNARPAAPLKQRFDCLLDLAALLNPAPLLFQLFSVEELHRWSAGHSSLGGDLGIVFQVDFHPLGGAFKFIEHPLELGLNSGTARNSVRCRSPAAVWCSG